MFTVLLARDVTGFTCMWMTDGGTKNVRSCSVLTLFGFYRSLVLTDLCLRFCFHRSWISSLRGSAFRLRSRRRFSGSSWTSWGMSWPPNSLQPMRRYDSLDFKFVSWLIARQPNRENKCWLSTFLHYREVQAEFFLMLQLYICLGWLFYLSLVSLLSFKHIKTLN